MKIASIPVNYKPDFPALKSMGVEAIYLCACKGQAKDPTFESNYILALENGFKVGFYHYFEASKRNKMVTAGAKEGRTFGAAIKGKEYDLPICLHLVGNHSEAIPLRNGINAWAQYVDKILNKPPMRWTDKIILRGTKDQLEVADEDEDNDCYRRWVLGYEGYNKACVKQIDCTGDDVIISEGKFE